MAIQNFKRQVIANARKGIKRVTWKRRLVNNLPPNLVFTFSDSDADMDASGKINVSETRIAHRLQCGCYVDRVEQLGGYCVSGLFVCARHLEDCPRCNRSLSWGEGAVMTPCRRRCALIIGLRRFLHWLFTPPRERPRGKGDQS